MLRRVAYAGFARGVGALFGFGMSVLIGRQLGVAGAGQFFLGLTIMTLVSQFTRFGFPFYLMRFGSLCLSKGDWATLRSSYYRSLGFVLILSFMGGGLLWLSSGWVATKFLRQPEMKLFLQIFSGTLIPFSILFVNGGLLKGIGKPELAHLTEAGMLPIFVVAGLWFFHPNNVRVVSIGYLATCILIATLTTFVVLKTFREKIGPSDFKKPCPLGIGFGFDVTIIAIFSYAIISLPLILLGKYSSPEAVGAYSVAHRTVMIIGFCKIVVSSVYLPQFPPSYSAGNVSKINWLYMRTVKLVLVMAIPICLVMMIFPRKIMEVFGNDFGGGALPLQILSVGYLVSLCFGPADEVLLMFGETKAMKIIVVITLLVQGVLAIFIIPLWGGAAAGTVTGLAFIARSWGARIWMSQIIRELEFSGSENPIEVT